MSERRLDPRVSGPIVRHISALVRPGQWVLLLDLSASGALIAGRRQLRPGARVEIHFHSDGHRSAVWAAVLRCSVAAMDADRVVYHAALNFERRVEWVREPQTQIGAALPAGAVHVEHG
jgi:hypothetical protein